MDAKRYWTHSVWLIPLVVLAGGSAAAQEGGGREYDRGWQDAKAGSYDRGDHGNAYEAGWHECRNAAGDSSPALSREAEKAVARSRITVEWKRGCGDARSDSKDTNSHSMDYENGWRFCEAE